MYVLLNSKCQSNMKVVTSDNRLSSCACPLYLRQYAIQDGLNQLSCSLYGCIGSPVSLYYLQLGEWC